MGLHRQVRTNSLIVATGALAKRLGIPNEEVFWSSGISACAICDGASHIFRNKACTLGGQRACARLGAEQAPACTVGQVGCCAAVPAQLGCLDSSIICLHAQAPVMAVSLCVLVMHIQLC